MHVVSWNCRGFGNPSKVKAVKDLLKIESPEILMLQETKIEGETLLEINNLKWKKNAGKPLAQGAAQVVSQLCG
jgi:exonuclease III